MLFTVHSVFIVLEVRLLSIANACDGTTDEEETLKMEWKRSFVGARVNRIKSEARSERVALIWDPSSDGGVARYFPLNDDRIFSLTRCVSDACEL